MNEADLDMLRGLEAVLFLADHPLASLELAHALACDEEQVASLLAELGQRLTERQSGLVLRHAGGGWRLYTAADTRDHVERHLLSGRSPRLSQAALETLAVIAYKQPVTRSGIGDIRGVNVDGAVRSLVARGLAEEVGRDEGPGQAVLYGTTSEFLERVGLATVDDLPELTGYLPEDPAPDEPAADQLRRARQRLRAGGELPSTGAPRWDPDADADEQTNPAQQARRARRDAVARQRAQDTEMDELTGRLERVAQSAMAQLRVAAEARDDGDPDPDDPETAL